MDEKKTTGRKRKKNDNFERYRKESLERNEALVRRAVSHILDIGGEPNFSLVSRVTQDIADRENGEKGLTAAALSKNRTYREIIQRAKEVASREKGNDPPRKGGGLSEGDMRMALYQLRVENAGLKRENRILAAKLEQRPEPSRISSPVPQALLDDMARTRGTLRSLIERLMEKEYVFVEKESGDLVFSHFGDVLLRKEALDEVFNQNEKKGYGA